MSPRHFLTMFAVLACLCASTAQAQLRYEVRDKPAGGYNARALIATDGDQSFEIMQDDHVSVAHVADFNGDGHLDALVSSSCLGNSCQPGWHFVGRVGKSFVSAWIGASHGRATPRRLGGGWVVDIEDTDGRRTFRFDGRQANKVAAVQTPVRKALLEARGAEAYTHEGQTRELSFDLDRDGQTDRIHCKVGARWGSLLCEVRLSRGAGQQFSTGCDRFGILESITNGRHDLVCNSDLVWRYDGQAWR